LAETAPTPVPTPTVQLAPYEGKLGTLVTVTGKRWQQGNTVFICLDERSSNPEILTFAVVIREGQFTTKFISLNLSRLQIARTGHPSSAM
jgi:hypothetical protein